MFKKILYITNLEVSVSVSASLPVTYPEKCGSDVALNKKINKSRGILEGERSILSQTIRNERLVFAQHLISDVVHILSFTIESFINTQHLLNFLWKPSIHVK